MMVDPEGQGGERDRTYDDKGPWDANGTRRVTTRHHAGKRPHDLSDFVQRFGHIYESSRTPSHGRKEIKSKERGKRKECRLYCLGSFNYQRIVQRLLHAMEIRTMSGCKPAGCSSHLVAGTIQFQPECWIPRQYQY
ncbi:hypothetical protein BO79DRAFT_226760 [Aspergillus costaricaensis CBS 115574]|uniref:Uncharacterized protein n=1 Tax=Aspergillus costaricaensis CBS 115574 TaxID=1448317 RepID=A0ACD1IMQ4_9EURO|nr:hypothetical protein BO79DRAFT_226760 [Aspergillus costaricaensis CBS 115574]RAK91004.1 hypothetical protein BO79DRAFT_226760 [Aspergillus costaricaensis CBS 115574]